MLEEHLTYVWIAGVRYSYPNNIFPLRIKNTLKLLLLFSKGAYDPGPTQFWLHDLIDGDGLPRNQNQLRTPTRTTRGSIPDRNTNKSW